jgi:hypothetical protein
MLGLFSFNELFVTFPFDVSKSNFSLYQFNLKLEHAINTVSCNFGSD